MVETQIVIVTTISHLYFVLFITFVTFAVATLLCVIVYSYTYTILSPNTALLSCLLRTLGIVIQLCLNILSCLLRTLAVRSLATVARNFAVVFSFTVPTCHVTRNSPGKAAETKWGSCARMCGSVPCHVLLQPDLQQNWFISKK